MIMPKDTEGHFICTNCDHRMVFPTVEDDKVVKVKMGLFGQLQFPIY